jgi:PspA-Associated protein
VIVRILGEGQYDVADGHIEALNRLDATLESAVENGDEQTYRSTLDELLTAIRVAGSQLPDDSLQESQLVLPPADATLEEVREMLGDEGLIPG